ncbi:MAG TPA: 2OG-Fe(II) oxygenase family protein [Vicinamibacteria bacterium]|nr:2OG-Fe(II) oxygenase family protein [Vicinamibacteria bacterium]
MDVLEVRYGTDDAGARLARSLRETGFAVVAGHPVPRELISEAYAEWERFFASPAKHDFTFDVKRQDGYFPFRSENAKGHAQKDLKEFFHVYPGTSLPERLAGVTRRLYDALSTLAGDLLGLIEDNTPEAVRRTLSMPLRRMIDGSPQTLFRILRYPPLSGHEEEGAVRAAAHEDINLITLLVAATAPGLQVLDVRGRWRDVPADSGSIVVNSGDMLQMATGGHYRSTTHRVVNPTGEEARKPRLSMPLFLHPWPEVRLSATRTAGEYLDERLREIGLK